MPEEKLKESVTHFQYMQAINWKNIKDISNLLEGLLINIVYQVIHMDDSLYSDHILMRYITFVEFYKTGKLRIRGLSKKWDPDHMGKSECCQHT